MSAIKRFAEEVSEILGYQGELSERVMEVAEKAMALVTEETYPYEASNPKFRELVERCRPADADPDEDLGPSYGEAMQRMNER